MELIIKDNWNPDFPITNEWFENKIEDLQKQKKH